MNPSDDRSFQASSLCVVGNINRDLKTAPLMPGDHLFRDGETSVSSMLETVGGGGANSACAAASLGAKVAFIGKVGDDALGRILEQTLIRHGVTTHVARVRAQPTGTSINLTFENGQRHFISCLPNNEALTFQDIQTSALPRYSHLFRADVWFSSSMLFGGNERLFRSAREAGAAISLDLNWDPHWGRAGAEEVKVRKQAVRSVLAWVDLAHGNVRELNEFADSPDLETSLARLAAWGVKAVVVHLGENGAGYYAEGKLEVEPSAPARSRVNTTGTGDVLSVCMMLLHGRADLAAREKLRLANAIVTEFIEGQRSMIPRLCESNQDQERCDA